VVGSDDETLAVGFCVVNVYERISEAITHFEEQGGAAKRIRVSDEVWEEIEAEVARFNEQRAVAASETQAFLDEISDRFPSVQRRSAKKWVPKKLEEGDTIYGLALGRIAAPGYLIEVS
jgi:hypothetical protein